MTPRPSSVPLSVCLLVLVALLPASPALAKHHGKKQPLKVFILCGQSNMVGTAHARVLDYLGEHKETKHLYKAIKDADGGYKKVPNTYISYLTGGRSGDYVRNGQLMFGYGGGGPAEDGTPGTAMGPELAFGITMQAELKQPILIIKTAWGGKSLHTDFRSPSSGPYEPTADDIKAKRFESPEKKKDLEQRTGAFYRKTISHVKHVLKDIKQVVPGYDAKQGYEIAGFVWFQGWNDMVGRNVYPNRDKPGGYDNYTKWMANFIRDIRKDLDAPKLPFVIGVLGAGGPLEVMGRYRGVHSNFRNAMEAPSKMKAFKGNVAAVRTGQFWDMALHAVGEKKEKVKEKENALKRKQKGHENEDGKMSPADIKAFMAKYQKTVLTDADLALEKRARSNQAYHYMGNAKTFALIGDAFAKAVIELHKK